MGRTACAVIPEFRPGSEAGAGCEISETQEPQDYAAFLVTGSRLSPQSRSGRDDKHG
jgi:hypothetical protein